MLDFDKIRGEDLEEWRQGAITSALIAKLMRYRTTESQNAVDSIKTTVPNHPYQQHLGGKLTAIDDILLDIMRK